MDNLKEAPLLSQRYSQSPTKGLNSSKKRTLKFSVKRAAEKNITEVSASPIRKSLPLLTSTPKPSSKNPQLPQLPSVPSYLLLRNVDSSILKKTPVILLDRSVVSDYFAKKSTAPAAATNPAKNVAAKSPKKSPKKPGLAKQAAEKKQARAVRNPRATKVKQAKQAATVTPLPSIKAIEPTEEVDNAGVTSSSEPSVHQQMGPCDGIATKIPSEVLATFGITSHQAGSESPCSTVTEPLSPKPAEDAAVPDADSRPASTEETPSIFDIVDTVPHSTSILIPDRISESNPARLANNCAEDALDSGSCSDSEEQLPVTSHCDLYFELNRRLYDCPKILQLDDLSFSCKDVRRVAPYSLKIADDEEEFFLYAAALKEVAGKYCCLLFGVLDQYMIAYGGHFIVSKDRIYDPVLKRPVKDVSTTSLADCRHHLCLFNIPNEKLLQYSGYFQHLQDPSNDTLQSKFVDSFLHSLDQVVLKERIRCETVRSESFHSAHSLSPGTQRFPVTCTISEPRTQQVFHETSLLITQERMDIILNFVHAMGNVKKRYAELAVMQASCALHPTFDSAHYAAHEDSGCTAFYPAAYVLGSAGDHYVVGVVIEENFFVMATKRLFSRADEFTVGMQPVARSAELFDSITLPLRLPFEHALAMLEVRQILRQPGKHQDQLKEIIKALGISGFRPSSLTNSFFDITSATQPKSRRLHNAWLEQSLDGHFSAWIRNARCKLPTHPACSANPLTFCENMLRLWMQRLQREIYDIAECDVATGPATALSQQAFFTLGPSSFVGHFLPLFGLSEEHTFQCLTLDSHGEPSGVCQEKIRAPDVGRHIDNCHVRPLLWDDSAPGREMSFCPFVLVFRKRDNPALSGSCEPDLLNWARSFEAEWSARPAGSYLQLAEAVNRSPNKNLQSASAEKAQEVSSSDKQRKRHSPGRLAANKRKRSVDAALVEEELKRRCIAQRGAE